MKRLRRSYFPSEDVDWILDTYTWLLINFGGWADFSRQPLVLPNDDFFPVPTDLPTSDLATTLFQKVKEHARLDGWPVSLLGQEDPIPPRAIMPGVPMQTRAAGEAGTISLGPDGHATITYSPDSLRDPMRFVATMSHELSHYLMSTAEEPFAGSDVEMEMATDVCATFIGYGIFLANAVFSFSQFGDYRLSGWEVHRQQYLDERLAALALSVFLATHDIPTYIVLPYLKTNPRHYVQRAVRTLKTEYSRRLFQLRDVGTE